MELRRGLMDMIELEEDWHELEKVAIEEGDQNHMSVERECSNHIEYIKMCVESKQ